MIVNLLQPSINLGLSEASFWDMTPVEVERYSKGAVWRLQSQARFDYSLANLIGISVGRIMGGNDLPDIMDIYPDLFQEEIEAKKKQQKEEEMAIENSKNRFLEFALKHNAKMKKKEVEYKEL